MTTSQTDRIRELNDIFRTTWLTGKVLMTCGVQSLAETTQSRVVEAVLSFTAFTADNDPHGEHHFGAVTVDGQGPIVLRWKRLMATVRGYDQNEITSLIDAVETVAQTRNLLTHYIKLVNANPWEENTFTRFAENRMALNTG